MFRLEVLEYRKSVTGARLFGPTIVAVPITWTAITILFTVVFLSSLLFLGTASYSRTASVVGMIVPDAGVARIISPRDGVVAEVFVKEGGVVNSGDPLLRAEVLVSSESGSSLAQILGEAEQRERAGVIRQTRSVERSITSARSELKASQDGLESQIAQIIVQMEIQKQLIDAASIDLARAKEIALRGFLSKNDLARREEALLTLQVGLSRLRQESAAKRSSAAELTRVAEQREAELERQLADTQARIAQLDGKAAAGAVDRSFILRAPVNGRVSALAVRKGQPIDRASPGLALVPLEATMQAELKIPSSAVGFVKAGQAVRIGIDAYPRRQFGSLRGTVTSIARSPLFELSADGTQVPYYPAIVELERSSVRAFGQEHGLVSGMTIEAKIGLGKRSLIEWLFEPIFAVADA